MEYIKLFEDFNKEISRDQIIYSNEFKMWFGDWENDKENSSKVLDATGKPMIVYHGSKSDSFDVFDKAMAGKTDPGFFGKGYYFTPVEKYAKSYGSVIECYLNIRHPLDLRSKTEAGRVVHDTSHGYLSKFKIDKDHDGVFVFVDNTLREIKVPLENANCIKLTDNITFDSNNTKIDERLRLEM